MSSPGNGENGHQGQQEHQSDPEEDPAWQLRKYLLLLAILVATVTYVAGLDPPGGVWLDTKDGHRTGDPILRGTRHLRYTLFYYFNATAFAVSLVVSILLLFMRNHDHARPLAVRGIMVVDVFCLMVAYVAGSCRDRLTTIYASVVCAIVFLFVIVFTWRMKSEKVAEEDDQTVQNQVKEKRKVLMLLAIFVAMITYTAALNSPGGFWEHADQEEGHHNAGDPILLERHWRRFVVFLLFNTTAFAASLVILTLLLSRRLRHDILNLAIVVALIGLTVSYAAGSSRMTKTTAFVFSLVGLVAAYIAAVALIPGCGTPFSSGTDTSPHKKDRSLILLLATLAATVTYQAGLSPPGGVWRDNGNGHSGGDLILPATHAMQYQVFFFCNSAAFVTSIIVVMMVQSMDLVNQHALKAAVILDLLGLIAAYVAGSCRDVLSSIYVLAAVIVVVMVILLVVKRSPTESMNQQAGQSQSGIDQENKRLEGEDEEEKKKKEEEEKKKEERDKKMEKRRKLLLLLAILAVTVTYQAGFSPPGKFWLEDGDEAHHVGDPVLADNYPRRYKVFFHSNTVSFMMSIAVILMLVDRNRELTDANRNHWYRLLNASLFVSLIGLAGLLLAYAAGTTRKVKTSVYVLGLVLFVLQVAFIQIHHVHKELKKFVITWELDKDIPCFRPGNEARKNRRADEATTSPGGRDKTYRMRKYLMLVSILAASVTYQAGLDPPGGVWPSNADGHAAGDPALHNSDRGRYHAFFYSNSTCFVASVVVIVLLLQGSSIPSKVTHSVVVLDLLGLLVAYAVGSSRDWHTSGYVLAMAASVLAYVAIYVVLSYANPNKVTENQATLVDGAGRV